MTARLQGKVALVTGGGSGIGRATAQALAREGAPILVADVDVPGGEETVHRIKEDQGEATFLRTDVSRASDVETMVEAVIRSYGRLDCAFNNAGINLEDGPLTNTSEEVWDRVIGVNLKGIWLCLKYEIPRMIEGGGGAIVNTSSILGLVGTRGVPTYVASKHGVIGLTRAAALDFGRQGIRVNAVCPGTIRTPMYERRVPDEPEIHARMAADTAIGRIGTGDDIAEAVIWLLSDSAAFVSGTTLVVDGGELA